MRHLGSGSGVALAASPNMATMERGRYPRYPVRIPGGAEPHCYSHSCKPLIISFLNFLFIWLLMARLVFPRNLELRLA